MFDKNIRYKDILIFALIAFIGYKIIDNYNVIFSFIGTIISITSPFIYALVFAYVLNPIMKLFEKKFNLKRGMAIAITFICILGSLVLMFVYVLPNIVDSIISISSEMPVYMETVQKWVNGGIKNEDFYNFINEVGLLEYIQGILKEVGTIVVSGLQGSVSSILSIATNMVKIGLGFFVSIYVLSDKEKIIKEAKTVMYLALKEEKGDKLLLWLRIYNKMIGAYVGTKALDSLIIGVISLIGLLILKAPYAILLAIVVGFTNMIPYFGPFIGELVGAFVGIFVSPSMAIGIFVFLLALQQFDAWYLDPKLVGKKVGVSPLLIIVGVLIGGGLFGPVGMILASPTIATFKLAYEQRVNILKVKNKNLMNKINEDNEVVIDDDDEIVIDNLEKKNSK